MGTLANKQKKDNLLVKKSLFKKSSTSKSSKTAQKVSAALAQVKQRVIRPKVTPVKASEPITIIDLRPGMCKWPIGTPGEPTFRFCGKSTLVHTASYCAGHAQEAYHVVPGGKRLKKKLRRDAIAAGFPGGKKSVVVLEGADV